MTDNKSAMERLFHFEVQGVRRDYDYTTFCEKHCDEALTYAQEWLAEVLDGCDIGDQADVTVHVRPGLATRCYECDPMEPRDE